MEPSSLLPLTTLLHRLLQPQEPPHQPQKLASLQEQLGRPQSPEMTNLDCVIILVDCYMIYLQIPVVIIVISMFEHFRCSEVLRRFNLFFILAFQCFKLGIVGLDKELKVEWVKYLEINLFLDGFLNVAFFFFFIYSSSKIRQATLEQLDHANFNSWYNLTMLSNRMSAYLFYLYLIVRDHMFDNPFISNAKAVRMVAHAVFILIFTLMYLKHHGIRRMFSWLIGYSSSNWRKGWEKRGQPSQTSCLSGQRSNRARW